MQVLALESRLLVEGLVGLGASKEQLVASHLTAKVAQLVNQSDTKLLAALRVVHNNVLDVASLGASSKELLLDDQGASGNNARLLQVFNDNDMVHCLASEHGFEGLKEGLFRDLAYDGQACEAVIESLVVICALEWAHQVALGKLGLDICRDQGGREEGL